MSQVEPNIAPMKCEICQKTGAVHKPRPLLDVYMCGECLFQLERHVEDWILEQTSHFGLVQARPSISLDENLL